MQTIAQGVSITVQAAGLYLLADLIGGLFHWAEDTLGSETTPLWGRYIVRPNMRHHDDPGHMISIPWYINNLPIAGAISGVLFAVWLAGALSWQVLLLGLFCSVNQQVHRFQHTPRLRLPRVVAWLMRYRLLQNARHHWIHHTDPHTSCYCVLTPWLNPILDRVGFWRALERILAPVFGSPRRPDIVAQPWYPSK